MNRVWLVLSALCLFLTLGLHVKDARAAVNVSYTWTDQQTIQVSGSSLKSPVSLVVAVFNPDIPNGPNPNLPGLDNEQGNVIAVDKAGDCEFRLQISISPSGLASAQGQESPSGFSQQGGSVTSACTSAIYNQYTKSPITFTNSRGASPIADETAFQRSVSISIKSNAPFNVAIPSITVHIVPTVSGGGPTTLTLTLLRGGSSSTTPNEYSYSGVANGVEPGKYRIYDDSSLGSAEFEKIKYQHATVDYGESISDKTVTANVNLTNYPMATIDNRTFGPLTLVLTPPDGGAPVEVQTNSAQLGSFSNSDTADGTSSTIEASISGMFDNVEANPNKYRVCVKDTTICAEFTKVTGQSVTVDLALTGDLDRFVTTTGTEADTGPTCESSIGSFGGLVCPMLEGIDSFIGWAEDKIENQLTVDLGKQETRDSLQTAWRVVARLASGILVAIALVMVISTALGSDLVSPYALKKVLPRLVIGAIGIWLSWALVTTYIDIINDLGKGISGIMLLPFGEAKEFSLSGIAAIAGSGGGEVTGAVAVFTGLAIAGVMSAGVFGIISMGLTALFAFVVAIFVLALRQAVIVFLVIMAPLGFAMWILPNTQKTWKLWSGTLNKLLIMYPMIMGLLAAGKIFAWITSQSAAKDAGFDKFLAFSIALIAYVAPYFFLPALFKAAGGIFSNLTGMVNDKGKGFLDKYKGGLDERGKKRQAFKDQMSAERQARRAAGSGIRSSFSRASMRSKGGQPITGGVLTLRNRAATTQRVQSSMAAAQEKLEEQQIQEETTKMLQSGTLNNRGELRNLAVSGSVVQRRAAINRLMQISDEEGLRSIRATSLSSTDKGVREMWGKVQSSKEFSDAFREKAPELTRSPADVAGAWNNLKPEAITKLSAESIKTFFATQRAELASGDPTRIREAETRISDANTALKAAVQTDALRGNITRDQVAGLTSGMAALAAEQTAGTIGGTLARTVYSDPANRVVYTPVTTTPTAPGEIWLNSASGRYEKS